MLQTQTEARTGKNKEGCKMFNCPDHLNSDMCKGKWDRLQINLKRIHSKSKQMGLQFVRISNSRNLKDKKLEVPGKSSKESFRNNWNHSSIERLRHEAASGERPEIGNLRDKLLRICGTTEDGSSNENTLTRTAKMVISSRAALSRSTDVSTGIVSNNRTKDVKSSENFSELASTSHVGSNAHSVQITSCSNIELFDAVPRTQKSETASKPSWKSVSNPNRKQCVTFCTQSNPKKYIHESPRSQCASQTGSPNLGADHQLHTPGSKRPAMPASTTPQTKSCQKLHPQRLNSNSAAFSKKVTPNAKRFLKLHPTRSSRGRSTKFEDDYNACLNDDEFTQAPLISLKSALSPKLHPTSHRQNSLRYVSISQDGSAGKPRKIDTVRAESDVFKVTADLLKPEIKRIKKKIERFFNSLDLQEMDPDKVTLKELRVGFEVMFDVTLDKNGREYFRNATTNFLDLVMNVKRYENSECKEASASERKRTHEQDCETATTSKSRCLSLEDCEIVETTQGVQCPLCMSYFPQNVITDHAALCGEDLQESGSQDVEIISTRRPEQRHRRETFIDLSNNMGVPEAEKQRWLDFSTKPKPYHPRMDSSLYQGHQLVKCPTCGQYYKSNDIQEHSDECAEKVNSGFVKRGLYFIKDGN